MSVKIVHSFNAQLQQKIDTVLGCPLQFSRQKSNEISYKQLQK